ncbi:MAG: hypothetical protein NZM00_01045, partial [Anaerolinea sp.]|nr:hypothetical protein [Anaerolinea sp.]
QIVLIFGGLMLLSARSSVRLTAQPADERIETLLAALTPEQQIAQMFMVTLHGPIMTNAGAEFLRAFQPGAISLFAANVVSVAGAAALTADFQRTIAAVGGVPLLIAVDQEGGVVARLTEQAGFTVLPAPILLAAAGTDMTERAAALTARQLQAVGIQMNLAPVADLETNRTNPIIRRRSFGSRPDIVSEAIVAYVSALQSGGVMATLKHFPGHGEAAQDSHAVLQALDLTRERLETVELVPFRAGIAAGAAAVMVAHIWYPAYDVERLPASLSHAIVTDLLRDQLDFDGLVLTDALDMNAVDLEFPFAEAVIMAVEAGVDLIVLGPSSGLEAAWEAHRAVLRAVQGGRISPERIEQSVRRILRAKLDYGILDGVPVDPAVIDREEGQALIAELFAAAVTVVRDDAGLIPLDAASPVTLIFPGTRYDIQRECAIDREDIRWWAVNDTPTEAEVAAAASLGRDPGIFVVWTQNVAANPALAALVNALPPERTVAVALASPYDLERYSQVSAYLALYVPSPLAIPPACAVLFGARTATGRLPVILNDSPG